MRDFRYIIKINKLVILTGLFFVSCNSYENHQIDWSMSVNKTYSYSFIMHTEEKENNTILKDFGKIKFTKIKSDSLLLTKISDSVIHINIGFDTIKLPNTNYSISIDKFGNVNSSGYFETILKLPEKGLFENKNNQLPVNEELILSNQRISLAGIKNIKIDSISKSKKAFINSNYYFKKEKKENNIVCNISGTINYKLNLNERYFEEIIGKSTNEYSFESILFGKKKVTKIKTKTLLELKKI